MISEEIMKDYHKRAINLRSLFCDNLARAQAEMVVKDSPVDFATYKFICSIYDCSESSTSLTFIMMMYSYLSQSAIDAEMRECIKKTIKLFHSLEKELALQNDFLEIRTSRKN